MARIDRGYHLLLNTIFQNGYRYEDPNRKGTYRMEIPSYTFRHEFRDGFPALTTKELNFNNIIVELLWFLKGKTNIQYLVDRGCNIWNKDAYKYYLRKNNTELEGMPFKAFRELLSDDNYKGVSWFDDYVLGDLGPVYGAQWRDSDGVDQIRNLIKGLKEKPFGTEHIVMAWNPKKIPEMALPPCHYGFQVMVRPLRIAEQNLFMKDDSEKGWTIDHNRTKLGFELHWSQRSVDTFLGLPYNIASYASLALILEKITGYKALGIQGDLKKVHLYENSLNPAREQLSHDPYKMPNCKLKINRIIDALARDIEYDNLSIDDIIDSLLVEDFRLEGYQSYPAINVAMIERDE